MMSRTTADNRVVFSEIRCAFCGGRGKDPFDIMSSLSTCCVCGGSGKVRVPSPYMPCAHCRGTGSIKTFSCTTCGGKGSVSRPTEPLIRCPVCRGTGDDSSAPALACLKCRGRGYVTRGEQQP